MKKFLREEEYNQIIKIGEIFKPEHIEAIRERLDVMGIYFHIKNNELYIEVEQDRKDPHYVDDIIELVRNEYNDIVNSYDDETSFKLAESEVKWILNQCAIRLTEGSVFNEATFAIVKSQAKKNAYNKVKKYFIDSEEEPRTNFDRCIKMACTNMNGTQKEICHKICNAIDCLMNSECREPGMSTYDMFSLISKHIQNYI